VGEHFGYVLLPSDKLHISFFSVASTTSLGPKNSAAEPRLWQAVQKYTH